MSEDFLDRMRQAPPREFARALRERLLELDRPGERVLGLRPAPAFLIAATLLLVAGSLAFPSVRERARAFLDLFREHEVTEVRFDAARFEDLRGRIGERSPIVLPFEDPEVLEGAGAPSVYPTVEAAMAATGVVVSLPVPPPSGMTLGRVEISDPARTRWKIDRDRLHEIIDRLDLEEVRVPRSLAEGSLDLRRPRMASLVYMDGQRWVRILEGPAPALTPSAGFDPSLVGEIGLRVAGIEDAEARRLASSIDWGSTLVVPMPAGAGSFRATTVHGAKAFLVSSRDAATDASSTARTLFWTEAGRLHALAGTIGEDEMLRLAESVRPAGGS